MTARPIGSDLLGRPAAASHGIGFGRLAPWLGAGAAFLCGLAIPFNVILLSQAGQDVRLLDVVSMAMFPVALWLSLRRTYLLLALLLLGVVFFLPSLIQAAVLFARYDELNDIVFPVRFLTAIVLCGALTPLLDRARPRSLFALGMGLGCCLNIIPLVFERLGRHQTMVALGLAPSDLAVQPWDLQLRPPGLHGHANATSAVISLAIPVAAFMAGSSPRRWWLLLPLAVGAQLACSYYTETRGAVLVSVVTLAYAAALRWRAASLLVLAPLLGLAALVAAGLSDGPLLPQSFTRLDTAGANATERLSTMAAGLQVMLEQPWGLGRTLGSDMVYRITGVGGTTATHVTSIPMHNSFVWLGVTFGLVPVVLTLVGFIAMATRAGRLDADGLRGLLAFHIFGLCLFEDHFQNASFIALLMLLLGGWLAGLLAPAPPNPAYRGPAHRGPAWVSGHAAAWRGQLRSSNP